MVPWVLMYAANILMLFAASIVMFYSFPGGYKSLGLVALATAIGVLIGEMTEI